MKKFGKFLIDVVEVVLLSIILYLLLINFVFHSVIVDGRSMEPTLKDGDRGISFVVTKAFGIDRFDIVTIDVGNDKTIVKRVIGLPNETIEYKDNKLYIKGQYLEEPFLAFDTNTADFTYTLSDGEYFCLGDNREISRDSRYYGPFTKDDFITKDIIIFVPSSSRGIKK